MASEELRREIHEGLQVVENWNSANSDLFYGKADTIPGSDKENQEVSMLALHLRDPASDGRGASGPQVAVDRLAADVTFLDRQGFPFADCGALTQLVQLLDGEWGFAAGVDASFKAHQSGSADDGAGEEVLQDVLLFGGQRGQGGVFGEQLEEAFAEFGALGGQDELLGAAVVGVWMAFEVALLFEAIGDEGDVRGLAAHPFGELAQGHGAGQLAQRRALWGGQTEGGSPGPKVGFDVIGQAFDQPAQPAVGLGSGLALGGHSMSLLQLG